MLRIPFFHRSVNGCIQRRHFGQQFIEEALQLQKALPLLLDEAFQLFHLPLLRWELPHAAGYQIFELLGECISLLTVYQLRKLIRKTDVSDIILFPMRSPPSDGR